MIDLALLPWSRPRVTVLLGSIACTLAFSFAYVAFLYPQYSFFNFTYWWHGWIIAAVVFLLSVAPGLWMPTSLARPSQLLYWTLYVTVYIPSIFTVPHSHPTITYESLALISLLFISFAGLGRLYRAPLLTLPRITVTKHIVWFVVVALAVISLISVIRVYGGHLQLVSFLGGYEGLEEQRLAARDLEYGHSLIGYAYAFLSSVIAPFLMGYGLFKRQWIPFIAGALCEILLYSAAGTKATLLSVPMALTLYWLLRRPDRMGTYVSWGTAAILVLFTFLGNSGSFVGLMLAALVLLRIFGTPGQATTLYQDYFSDHPLTYFSHVRGVSSLIQYPYTESIPFVIGMHFWNSPDLSANAHFWAQDGLAGLGLIGIPVITLLAALIFWILDSVSDGLDPAFVAVAMSYQALNLSNGSLFTLLLTSGFAFQFIFFYLLPREGLQTAERTRSKLSPSFAS